MADLHASGNERSNRSTAHVLKALFAIPVNVTRLFGALPRMGERERAEARGLTGAINLRFTGEGAGDYHFVLRGDRVAVYEGRHPEARTTIQVSTRDFAAMLAGRLDFTVAQMTGKVRLQGDGELLLLLGGIVTGFRRASAAPGARGWPARRFARWVLGDVEPPPSPPTGSPE